VACPGCGTRGDRVHSRYQRRLLDTAVAGRMLISPGVLAEGFRGAPAAPGADRAIACPVRDSFAAGMTDARARRPAADHVTMSDLPPPPPLPSCVFLRSEIVTPASGERCPPFGLGVASNRVVYRRPVMGVV
jgi:hypothetical protein